MLTGDARAAFRDRLAVDDASWARGRGWALWKALATAMYTHEDPEDAADFARAMRVVDEILSD